MFPDEGTLLSRLVESQLALARSDDDPSAVHALLARLARELVGADGTAVELVDGEEMVYTAAEGTLAGSEGTRIPREGSMSGLVVATGRLQLCYDTSSDPRVDKAACQRLGIGSMAVLPLRGASRTVAVLKMAMASSHAVTATVVQPLIPLVEAAAARLGQLAAAADAAEQGRVLLALTSASREVLAADHPAAALTKGVAAVTGAAWSGFFELIEDRLTLTSQSGVPLPGFSLSLDEPSIAVRVWQTGKPRWVSDFRADPETAPAAVAMVDSAGLTGLHSAAFLPVGHGEHRLGVVAAVLPGAMNAGHVGLIGILDTLASEAAIAIERRHLSAQLAAQARTDSLTAVANRRAWDERAAMEIERAARTDRPLSLVMLDLDHFKAFNDTHGHPAGDALLRATATAWAAAIRTPDLIARLGGEEFGVLLPDTDLDDAAVMAARLLGEVPFAQTASAGVATLVAGETATELTARADQALYGAKAGGRNRVVAHSSDLPAREANEAHTGGDVEPSTP